MVRVRHPRDVDGVAGHAPDRVTVRGDTYAVARDEAPPTVELPTDAHVGELAAAYGLAPDDLRLTETHTCVGKDGECSREVDEPGGRCWQHAAE